MEGSRRCRAAGRRRPAAPRAALGDDGQQVAAVADLGIRRQVDGAGDRRRCGVDGLEAVVVGVDEEERVALLQHVEVRRCGGDRAVQLIDLAVESPAEQLLAVGDPDVPRGESTSVTGNPGWSAATVRVPPATRAMTAAAAIVFRRARFASPVTVPHPRENRACLPLSGAGPVQANTRGLFVFAP